MFKALVKKQMLEMMSMFFRRGKSAKNRSKIATAAFAALMIYAGACIFVFLLMMFGRLCEPLVSVGLGWMYFSLAGIMAVVLAIVGSVFMTQSMLYEAKDNEFLLSMPVPPGQILISRMLSLYVQNFLFSMIVFLPAVIVYALTAELTAGAVVSCITVLIILPLFSLTITCVLGWGTAFISSRMRNKTIVTMVLSLVFLGAYFYLYANLNRYLQLIVQNSGQLSRTMKTVFYPLYQMGLACTGGIKELIIFLLLVLLLFAAVYIILSKSFINIATSRHGAAKAVYKEKNLTVRSAEQALFLKELNRFSKSAVYMLNCGFGTILMLIAAAAMIIKKDWILQLVKNIPGAEGILPAALCMILCLIASTNAVSAPSVSLEGKNIWILQSFPVRGWDILRAKLKLHFIVTAPAAAICAVVSAAVIRASVVMTILMIVTPCLYVQLCGELGLLFNLKLPKLDWTNETVAVKQSMSVLAAIFAGWGIIAAFAIIYFALSVPAAYSQWYVLGCAVIIFAGIFVLRKVLKSWGAGMIMNLR